MIVADIEQLLAKLGSRARRDRRHVAGRARRVALGDAIAGRDDVSRARRSAARSAGRRQAGTARSRWATIASWFATKASKHSAGSGWSIRSCACRRSDARARALLREMVGPLSGARSARGRHGAAPGRQRAAIGSICPSWSSTANTIRTRASAPAPTWRARCRDARLAVIPGAGHLAESRQPGRLQRGARRILSARSRQR